MPMPPKVPLVWLVDDLAGSLPSHVHLVQLMHEFYEDDKTEKWLVQNHFLMHKYATDLDSGMYVDLSDF